MTAATFWRSHGKPRVSLKPRRGQVAADPGDARALMCALEQIPTEGSPRPRFCFAAGDVAAIYRHKKDEGPGIWFRLKDGRIYNRHGEPEPADPRTFME